jgi:hypothetical protein
METDNIPTEEVEVKLFMLYSIVVRETDVVPKQSYKINQENWLEKLGRK